MRKLNMLKKELDTPSLIIDLDIFEKNLVVMRDFASGAGKQLRPHAKTHKCPEIARRQLVCGNCAGICAAKLSEAEALAQLGLCAAAPCFLLFRHRQYLDKPCGGACRHGACSSAYL